jgi:hypothetical protein
MRKIIIGFSTPKKFKIGSALIRCYEQSEFSHIYIKMKTSPNSPLPFDKVFQASHGDVNAITYDMFTSGNKILHEYELDMDEDKYFEIYNWLWHQLGKDYGFGQLIAIATGIKIGNNDNSKFICSELAAMVLKRLGVDFGEDQDYIGLNDVKNVLDELVY